jgi:RNA polymerase sigma factor (sigma-70 family)
VSGDSSQPSSSVGNGGSEDENPQRVELWHSQQAQWLRVFVFGMLRNNELVADVLQTVFRKALEQGSGVDSQSVRAWLTRVAHNEALLVKRKQGVDSRAMAKLGAGLAEGDSASLPIDGLIQRETAERVRAAVRRLPPEQRFVVERRIHSDQTFADIAAELGLPLGTVLTRMRLALGKLRLTLGDESGE